MEAEYTDVRGTVELKAQKIVVVGQGYVGLPVAIRAVEVGFHVVGLDLDLPRIDSLKQGRSYVDDITDLQIRAALDSGRFKPSADYEDAEGFDFAVITVPTPLRDTLPDLSFIEASSRSLAKLLRPGATVVLESTTYPGTTQELLVPLLEKGSGLTAGIDFHVGYSPERIDPGNKIWGFVQTPKVVSGINPSALERVEYLYSKLVDTTVTVSSPKEAELTKLLENTFRHVNIALVNELAVFAHQLGVNIWESIDAASTKPFGFMKFTPGPGVGGHCLPVDPSYLSWQVRKQLGQNFRFVELANDVNDHMPDYVVQRLISLLNHEEKSMKGSVVGLVGLSYKKNTGDIRESPAMRIIELLKEMGATVVATDPHVNPARWPEGVEALSFDALIAQQPDVTILVTDHDDFLLDKLSETSLIVLDTRNKIRGSNVETL